MKKKIIFTIIFLSVFYCTGFIHGQECSVSLSGTYQLVPESEKGLYDAFVFDGGGKVGIHAGLEFKGDFFQVGDTVIVYPDTGIFTFLKKDEQTLVGINTWVKDQVFRRMENDTVITPAREHDEHYAVQFYKYYTLTGRDAPSLLTYMGLSTDSVLRASMQRLSDEGFPKACLAMANALMLGSPELSAYLRGSADENKKGTPNKEILNYFMKAIKLNELDAYAQLGAYYLMLGYKEEAIKTFEQGCELGHARCCLSLAGLEIDWE